MAPVALACYGAVMAQETTTTGAAAGQLDPVAATILATLRDSARAHPGATLSLPDVARVIADERRRRGDPPDLWRRYLQAVRQQALFLARRGDIRLLRRGEPVTADRVKGVVRLALPDAEPA